MKHYIYLKQGLVNEFTVDSLNLVCIMKRPLPNGVIGNTSDFGSEIPGSSPGWAKRRLTARKKPVK